MKRILLIDNDERFLDSMQMVLEREGYHVTCATDAKQAYTEIGKSLFNLILSNVSVPYSAGYELLVTLKDTFKKLMKNIPVVVVSEVANEATIAECKSIGVDEYVTRPIMMPEFLQRVNHFCR